MNESNINENIDAIEYDISEVMGIIQEIKCESTILIDTILCYDCYSESNRA